MKQTITIVETYWKEFEISAGTERKLELLTKEKFNKTSLSKVDASEKNVNFAKDIHTEVNPPAWECLQQIGELTDVNWYQQMVLYQRQDLTQEELFRYAEEMRLALERIRDITEQYEISLLKNK